MGQPGNLSKKGFATPQRTPTAAAPATLSGTTDPPGPRAKTAPSPAPPRVSSDAMVNKRTEWLEAQERRLTGTLEEYQTAFAKEQSENAERFSQIHDQTQRIYGRTTRPLMGFTVSDMTTAIEQYATKEPEELVADPDTWVLLQHPMHPAKREKGDGLLMKMHTVDSRTGQLGTAFAIIGTEIDGELTMSIGKFALVPA